MAKTTINGTILHPDDTPEEGYIYFALAETAGRSDVDAEFSRTPIRVNLDENGEFSIDLQPTDDADWSVDGLSYLVEERFSGKAPRRFYMAVPTSGVAVRYEDLATYANAPAIDANIDLAAEWVAWQATHGRRRVSTVCTIGDSISNQSLGSGEVDVPPANTSSFSAADYFTYANIALDGRLHLIKSGGVSGERTDEMLARVPADVIAHNPDVVIVAGGGNDVTQGVAAATIQTNLQAIYEACLDVGIIPVACTVLASDNMNTTGERDVYIAVNEWIRDYAKDTPGMVLCDWAGAYCDPTTVAARSGYTTDGVHPTNLGAASIGAVLADALKDLVTGTKRLCSTNYGSIILNPMMLGTAGTKAASVTGEQADSWTTSWSGATGSAIASKVARTDGIGGEWQEFQLTSSGTLQMFQQNTNVGTDFDIGQRWFAECEYEREDDWNVTDFRFYFSYFGSSGTVECLGGGGGVALLPMSGVLRTPVGVPVPVGTTRLQLFVRFNGTAGTLRVARARLVRVS